MELECYDLRWRRSGGIHLEALVDDGDGGKELLELPPSFDPYCYIEEDDLVMDPLRVSGCSIGEGAPDGYLKIEAPDPDALRKFDDRFAFQTYEADVHFNQRVAIDEDVTFARPGPEDVLYFDIEVDDRGTFTDPEDAGSRVIAIAGVGGGGEEFYFDDEDEEALLRGFLEAADGYKVLAGWNSLDYDFRYLENRCAKLGMTVRWGRWVRHDVMPLYDMLGVPTKTVSTKLEDTGQRELGEGKAGVSPGDGRLYELWESGDPELREYNMLDADLVRRIDQKFDLVRLLHVVCDLCNYPPGESCYLTKHDQVKFAIGQVVDAKLLEVAHRKGIPQPNRRAFDKPPGFPGGYVLDPVPGMYDWLVVPDYSGMYPNIVRAWNFGRETWVPDEHLERGPGGDWLVTGGDWEGCRAIKGETGGFVHPDSGERSVPAEAADELVEMREGADDIVDNGVKAVNNTLYGVFASDFHRYFGPHSENITLIGQELTGKVEEIAGDGHPDIEKVVYGDTDSVMIDMDVGAGAALDEAVAAAGRIVDDVEAEMKEWASALGAFARFLELDIDDVYDRFYIGDKKKRYFGHRVYKDGAECDDFKVRGFETRQGDWPEPVRKFQRELMEAKLYGEPTAPIIEGARDMLFSGRWDLEMATSTKLGQPVSDYEHPQPHTRAAEQIREEHGASAVQVGDKVDFIKYGGDTTDVVWVHDGEVGADFRPNEGWCAECGEVVRGDGHPHETADGPRFRPAHYSYLWDKKFVSVMESIDVSEADQATLGAFT